MAAIIAKSWTFTQVSGSQNSISLYGYSAPFGRPRQKPVVTDAYGVIDQTTYFAGKGVEPTVHLFGDKYDDWVLDGRWQDSDPNLGPGGAKTMVARWRDFISQRQICTVSWGEIFSYRCIVLSLEPGRESEAEVAWKLKIRPLSDQTLPGAQQVFAKSTPVGFVNQALFELDKIVFTKPSLGSLLDILPGIVDALSDVAAAVNAPFVALYNLCSALSSFETATIGELRSIRSAGSQLRTGLLNLRDTTEAMFSPSAAPTLIHGSSSATDVQRLASAKAQADVSQAIILAILADVANQVDIAARGQASTTYTAQQGDTWESISIKSYGAPDGAARIRNANGIRFGTLPLPSKSYTIPFAL